MIKHTSLLVLALAATLGCGRPPETASARTTSADGPATAAPDGRDRMTGDASRRGGGRIMGLDPMSGPRAGATEPELSAEARTALLRALDEEYRGIALDAAVLAKASGRAALGALDGLQRRHAGLLERFALSHGVDLPPNRWATATPPKLESVAEACRAGVVSETQTIALYDELLAIDLPSDLRRMFTSLRAAAADNHLPAFESCR